MRDFPRPFPFTRRAALTTGAAGIAALFLTACGGGGLLDSDRRRRDDLDRNRTLWASNGVSQDYDFTASYIAGSAVEVTFSASVRGGQVFSSSAVVASTGQAQDATTLTAAYGTVERMFTTIEAAFDAGTTISVTYDVARSYPRIIQQGTVITTDNEALVIFTVTSFTPRT